MIDIWVFDLLPKQKSEPFLRQILARYVEQSAEELMIERGEFGKPYLSDFPQWQFNLSHSGEKGLIAVNNEMPVGIDIELIKPRLSFDGIVEKCFALSEQQHWFSLSEAERLTTFYDFWTRKEAVVKGIGRGIALGLNRCEIDVDQPNNFLNLPVNEKWHTQQLEISPNYSAAVATIDANEMKTITIKTGNYFENV